MLWRVASVAARRQKSSRRSAAEAGICGVHGVGPFGLSITPRFPIGAQSSRVRLVIDGSSALDGHTAAHTCISNTTAPTRHHSFRHNTYQPIGRCGQPPACGVATPVAVVGQPAHFTRHTCRGVQRKAVSGLCRSSICRSSCSRPPSPRDTSAVRFIIFRHRGPDEQVGLHNSLNCMTDSI